MAEGRGATRSIKEAHEQLLPLGDGLSLWVRTWGTPGATPVLFVHGGPGNCVADYNDINAEFFDQTQFWVVEVDQRGTGKSQPSVRDDYRNMQRYLAISIEQMSADFEIVRAALSIEKWLVFGGSWGSTLGLDYAERYPERCLGLIVRGIFLNTSDEFDAVYARSSFTGNERRLKEFDTFFELASAEAANRGEPPLGGDDSQRFIRLYEEMVLRGDREAAWRFHVFENNLVEEDPAELLDPLVISEVDFPTALSVAFFECRLFLRGTFEAPLDLLGRVAQLKDVRTWVVQGTGDEVCPEKFAQELVARLKIEGVVHTAHFVDAGHRASSDGITVALKACVNDFLSGILTGHSG
eukprot:m.373551 g.373551  ORF g.373551 m.373551 type:complete len:353 (+) comp28162_c0_seq14:4087-5145(+)